MAIHSVRRMPSPVLLRLDIVGFGPITIDPRSGTYLGVEVAALPAMPDALSIETHPAPAAPAETGSGNALDGLLWFIGTHAFGSERATWLWPGDRYRLVRWPRLVAIPDAHDEVPVLAALGAAALNAAELAEAADITPERAQRTINALSLMGLLESESAAPPPTPRPPTAATGGLFGRLRKRLGWG